MEITPEVLKKAKELSSKFLKRREIADELGWGDSTLYRIMKESDEFAEAIREGKSKGVSKLKNKIYEKALEEGDTQCLIILLKNYSDLKDKHELEHSGDMPNNGGVSRVTEILESFAKGRSSKSSEGDVQE